MASPQGCCWVRPSTPPYSPTLDPFQLCGVALARVAGARSSLELPRSGFPLELTPFASGRE
jgi:hypothetical protein